MANDLIHVPQWSNKTLRLYDNVKDSIYLQNKALCKELYYKKNYHGSYKFACIKNKSVILLTLQANRTRKLKEMTDNLLLSPIIKSKYITKKTHNLTINGTTIGISYYDIKPSFLSFLINSKTRLLINSPYKYEYKQTKDITDEYIRELQELISETTAENNNIKFDDYINNWIKRLLNKEE